MRQRKQIRASIVALLAAVLATGLNGCWMLAAQFAPLAASAAETVGEGAVGLAAGVGASANRDSIEAKKEQEVRDQAMNSGDACNELSIEVPGVIELRRGASGTPQYRELQIAASLDQPQWAPIADPETTIDGWRPAVNFLQMNFTPPLGAVISESASSFLAYAPSQFVTAADGDRLTAMTSNFGKPTGTFIWNGHYYHYVVTSTLPCFPPPPERLAADAPVGRAVRPAEPARASAEQ